MLQFSGFEALQNKAVLVFSCQLSVTPTQVYIFHRMHPHTYKTHRHKYLMGRVNGKRDVF